MRKYTAEDMGDYDGLFTALRAMMGGGWKITLSYHTPGYWADFVHRDRRQVSRRGMCPDEAMALAIIQICEENEAAEKEND